MKESERWPAEELINYLSQYKEDEYMSDNAYAALSQAIEAVKELNRVKTLTHVAACEAGDFYFEYAEAEGTTPCIQIYDREAGAAFCFTEPVQPMSYEEFQKWCKNWIKEASEDDQRTDNS